MARQYSEEQRQNGVELINDIWWENGGMTAEERQELRTNSSERGRLRQIQSLRRKLSTLTKRVVDDLYSKETRFVYELIQNAEDNSYEHAASQGQSPFLKFSLYPGKIVVDSNEDGFSETNLRAICSTNQSTKTTTQGYIGEKGIGFKSVFKVAKKVHIQSEPYSFSFAYSRGSHDDEDGLGMVTPIQERYHELPENVQTRFTLNLIAQSDFSKRLQDLQDIPESLLLFLTKLQKLEIHLDGLSGDGVDFVYSHRYSDDIGLESVLKKKFLNGDLHLEHESLFRVFEKTATDLPFDGTREGIDQADVVLAFPVDKRGYPVLKSQHVFAYLPLRHVGFQFLIQSDFITQASREDIFHSPRNEALLYFVAQTFRDAVLSFCKDDILQHRWMRYLPPITIADEFWKKLRPLILNLLKGERILKSRRGRFYLPSQLSWVPDHFKDRDGIPLFPDLDIEVYMDNGYSKSGFELLKPLGSTILQWDDLVDRMAADLNRPDSKMKSRRTEDDWHTRAADLLRRPFSNTLSDRRTLEARQRLKDLPLVPIRGGQWTTCSNTIYFPGDGQGAIPTDLFPNLVHPDAMKNKSRAELFKALGVKECSVRQVLQWIRQKYEQQLESLAIEDSIQHLHYLFWNLPEDQESLGVDIRVVGVDKAILPPDTVYIPDARDEYSAQNLFNPSDGSTEAYPANFLPMEYLQAVPQRKHSHASLWEDWLKKMVGISSIPRLTRGTRLSEDFRYITKHRPDKLVGLLQKHLPEYESQMASMSNELSGCYVQSEGNIEICLESAYIPLPRLKALVSDVPKSGQNFVRLPESIEDEDEGKWMFLKQIGVRFSDDLNLYIKPLQVLKFHKNISGELLERAVYQIYNGIIRNCRTDKDAELVRVAFEIEKLIFIPGGGQTRQNWYRPQSCVWHGPVWLESTPSLSGHSKYANLAQLFQITLKLRDANWNDFIKELEEMQKMRSNDKRKTAEIYSYLSEAFQKGTRIEHLRAKFEEQSLVYVPLQEAWVPPSTCIWADNSIQIPRKHSISIEYAPLENFFHDALGVKKLDVPMLVDAIQEMSTLQPPPVDQLRNTFVAISEMTPANEDLMRLRSTDFLPVQLLNGDKKLVKPNSDFSVVDRTGYGEAFEGKAVLLNLSPTDVHACRSLLVELGLQDRLMSKAVEEITTAGRSIPNPRLTRNFQWKAYALFRCAVHFSSRKVRGKDRSLLELLQAATVHVSHHISKSLRLMQGPSVYTVDNLEANFHMDVIDGRLMLYVPAEKQKMEACYLEELPKHVFSFFDLSDRGAEAVLIKIIGSSSLEMVDNILEKAGIVEVQWVRRLVDSGIQGACLRADSVIDTQIQHPPESTDGARSISRQNSTVHPHANETDLILSARQRTLSTHSPDPQIIESIEQPVENTAYATLLERLIRTARNAYLPLSDTPSHCFCSRTSTLPTFNCADHHATYPSIFNFRSLDRDRKVGAAGELFAFEILNHLNLPHFSATANWLSTLRKEARACAAHAALEPWHGAETSDIVYHDAAGALTAELREKGYFGANAVVERPTYYIEVKTTTRGCEEPLFMSGAQYLRMQRMALTPGTRAAEVYVLVRVFNLEREDVGLRVYVDPERYKRAGVLAFNVDTWIVKPDNSQSFPERTIVLD